MNQNDTNYCQKLESLGLILDVNTGHIFYNTQFKPLELNFDLIFVRHGETYGNCGQSTEVGTIDLNMVANGVKKHEQRIFQGDTDTEINQLTAVGKQQAQDVAFKLEESLLKKNWIPTVILHSPLTRAKDTGLPFVMRNHFKDIYFSHSGIKEMSFGSWNNRRVCDFTSTDACHTFYRYQNALVKDHRGLQEGAENFCEVLLRAHATLLECQKTYPRHKILMFSHSMFGAACCILLGKGQCVEYGDYLVFDGKRSNGEHYTMPHAVPFVLNAL